MQDHNLLGWLFVGLVAGVLGKFFMPGKDPGGFVVTILLGIAGALLAGYLGRVFGIYDGSQSGLLASIVSATIGSLVLLAIYRLVMRGRT